MKKYSITVVIALMAILIINLVFNFCERIEAGYEGILYDSTNEGKDTFPITISSFFGQQLILNKPIGEQLSAIAKRDEMLVYCENDSILQIGNVRWRLNLYNHDIVLLTSVNPDAPQMLPVIQYINSIYGKPYDEYEDDYRWSSVNTLIRLRRVRSDMGGSVLFFDRLN